MIYARIDVNIINHEKALLAGPEAFGLWAWGMCYAQLHETNGRLPRVAVMSALGAERRVLRRAAVRLVVAGLWTESEDGSFQVHNYDRKNQSAEEIAARKAAGKLANAERQRAFRERRVTQSNAVTRPLLVTPVTGLEPEPSPEPTPTPTPEPVSERPVRRPMEPVVEPIVPLEPRTSKVLGNDGDGGAAWEAWKVGISRATGQPVSDMSRWDKLELVDFVNAHAGGRRGELLMAWISSTAETFARAHMGDGYGIAAKRCKAWLDGGRKTPKAARAGRDIVQSSEGRMWKLPEGFE